MRAVAITIFVLGCGIGPIGCGSDGAAAESTQTATTSTDGSDGGDDNATGHTGGTTEAPTTGADGYDPPLQECGNGYVEGDEQCDDGNDDDEDDCTSACLIPCGLEWLTLLPPPTPQSDLVPVAVERGLGDGVFLASRVREVSTDQEGNETVLDDAVVIDSVDGTGNVSWTTRLASQHGRAFPVGLAVGSEVLYVATTMDAADGGRDIVVVALGAADGSELWRHETSGALAGGTDEATGVAFAPDGSPVVTGQLRVGDGDDDVWVAKLDPVTGEAAWTATWSGLGSGQFSTDDGGPVAVAPDGSVYVFAREYIDFETVTGTVLRFPPEGGEATGTHVPITGTSSPIALEAAPDGHLVLAYVQQQGAVSTFAIEKLEFGARAPVWRLENADFSDLGDALLAVAVSPMGDVIAAGTYRTAGEDQHLGTWYQRLDPSSEKLCSFRYSAPSSGAVTPDLQPLAATSRGDAAVVITGVHLTEDETSLWVGSFLGE